MFTYTQGAALGCLQLQPYRLRAIYLPIPRALPWAVCSCSPTGCVEYVYLYPGRCPGLFAVAALQAAWNMFTYTQGAALGCLQLQPYRLRAIYLPIPRALPWAVCSCSLTGYVQYVYLYPGRCPEYKRSGICLLTPRALPWV